jgi:hypothetical protein
VNARLAPGGVVAGGGSFPLHIQANLSNSVGNGFFAPGYQSQPSFGTFLNLRPTAALPRAEGLPRVNLSASFDFGINNWLPASTNTGVYERQMRIGDPALAAILPAIFTEELTGVTMSLVFSARAPLSISSRQQNLITNVGGAAQFMWGSPETPIGTFFAQYTPSARGAFYSQPGATMPCEVPTAYEPVRPSGDPVNGLDELPVVLPRVQELLPNGECVIAGRQRLGTLNNSLATGWSTTDGAHNISLSLAWTVAFLRPLRNDPGLASPFASSQNFVETSAGSLSYTYTVPTDFPFFLSVGFGSEQPAWTADGAALRFPFYDFISPANNFTSASFDVTVGI